MRSGLLIDKVELWRKEVTQSSSGAMTENWSKIKTLKCYVYRASSRATVTNDEVIDIDKIRVQIRNQYDIREQDRIRYNEVMYDVLPPKPMDIKKRFLMIHCTRLNE